MSLTADAINELQALFSAAQGVIDEGVHGPIVMLPDHYSVRSVEEFADSPRRIRAIVAAADVESFIQYLADFAGEGTRIFFDHTPAKFKALAIIDYHHPDPGEPQWCTHKLIFAPDKSPAWINWKGKDRQFMPQLEFVEFIEDHIRDIAEPTAAELLEKCRDFSLYRSHKVRATIDTRSGTNRFEFIETDSNAAGLSVSLTEQIAIGVPVYLLSEPVKVSARIRYRIGQDQQLKLCYCLDDPLTVEIFAADKLASEIRDRVEAFNKSEPNRTIALLNGAAS